MSNRSYPGATTADNLADLPDDSPLRWIPAIPTPLNPWGDAAYDIARRRVDSLARMIASDVVDGEDVTEFTMNQYRFFRQFCEDWNAHHDREHGLTK